MAKERAALFGKLPTSLDFVRIQHDSQAAIELDTWTQQALQELLRANAAWPAMFVRFLFAPHHQPDALVGVLAASRDRAGRKFPVAVFVPQPAAALVSAFAAVPSAFEPFLSAAEQFISDAEQLPREELGGRLDGLPLPAPGALQEAQKQLEAELAQRSRDDFAQSLAGRVDTVEAACTALADTLRATRDAPAERPQVVDCPVGQPTDVLAWLALSQRGLAWRDALPSFFWNAPGAEGRLLLALGAPPALIPLWLGAHTRAHARLVRLQAAAGSAASETDGGSASLDEMFTRFTLNARRDAGGLT